MKLISEWLDKRFNITNYQYLTPKGLNLIVSINSSSVDFNFSVIVKGGSYYEDKIGVPQGTAHFLEHILYGNPNKRFKSREEIEKFCFGDRKKPTIFRNAITSRQFVRFFANSNYKAAERILEVIYSILDYPIDEIDQYFEKEKAIIKAELQRMTKDEQNESLMFSKFCYEKTYPEFTKNVVGTLESLDQITPDDLRKYFHEVFRKENVTICIQTPVKLTKRQIQKIIKLENCFSDDTTNLKQKIIKLKPEYKFGYFQDTQKRGVFFSLNYFQKVDNYINYNLRTLNYILSNLFYKLGNTYLRETKKLIYDVNSFNGDILFNYKNQGFKLSCDFDLLKMVLDESYNMIFNYAFDFLDSEHGKQWFESLISNYIFPRTLAFNISYAEDLGIDILDQTEYQYDLNKAIDIAQNVTMKEFKNYLRKRLKEPVAFWFVSDKDEKEISKIFKSSKFHKHFKK